MRFFLFYTLKDVYLYNIYEHNAVSENFSYFYKRQSQRDTDITISKTKTILRARVFLLQNALLYCVCVCVYKLICENYQKSFFGFTN